MKGLLITFLHFICFTNADYDKRLNDGCNKDSDCWNSWAYCNAQKKCMCIDGFNANKAGLCEYSRLYCPSFVSKSDTKIQVPGLPCVTGFQSDTDGLQKEFNNCSKTEFCFKHSNVFTKEGDQFGHCCPKLPSSTSASIANACPATPKTGGVCPTGTIEGTCNGKSHDCFDDIPNSSSKSCCPRACRGESLEVVGTGRCVKFMQNGQKCQYDVQCPPFSKCATNGTDLICQSRLDFP